MGFINLSQSQTSTIIGILIVALLLLDIHIRTRVVRLLGPFELKLHHFV